MSIFVLVWYPLRWSDLFGMDKSYAEITTYRVIVWPRMTYTSRKLELDKPEVYLALVGTILCKISIWFNLLHCDCGIQCATGHFSRTHTRKVAFVWVIRPLMLNESWIAHIELRMKASFQFCLSYSWARPGKGVLYDLSLSSKKRE